MNLGLTNKVAIITGTNNPRGIGAATALAFVREGVKVVLVYKKMQFKYDESKTVSDGIDRYHKALGSNAEEVEEQLRSLNADYFVLESDISVEQCVREIFDCTIERFGKIDILVNNAAAGDMDGNYNHKKLLAQSRFLQANVPRCLLGKS